MKTKILLAIILLSLYVLYSCSNVDCAMGNNEPTSGEMPSEFGISLVTGNVGDNDTEMNEYEIENSNSTRTAELADWLDRYVEIDYPCITGMNDIEKQDKINDMLKNEAYWYLNAWEDLEEAPENVSISVKYDILFKSDNYLCVNYSGIYFSRGAAHPLNFFYTVNIDMSTGNKLKLSDVVAVDSALISTIEDYFKLYIENCIVNTARFSNTLLQEPESAFILEQQLNERYWVDYLDSDLEISRDCSFYFTETVFGFSFPIQYAAGCHYEIEIGREDINEHLILENLYD